MKKILIVLILLLVAGCATISNVNNIKNENNLGKTFTVEGKVLNHSLGNNKIGVVTIQDDTGEILLRGLFAGIYDNPSITFYVKATGNLGKLNDEYYLEVVDSGFTQVREVL